MTVDVGVLDFETARLRIRPLAAADESLYCDLYTDAQTMRYIGAPLSPGAARRSFSKALRFSAAEEFGRLFLTVLDKSAQRAVGLCGIACWDARAGRAEIGVMLQPGRRGAGYAREALGELVERLLRHAPVQEVWAQYSADNPCAGRLFAKLGFTSRESAAVDDGQPAKCICAAHRTSWCYTNMASNQGEGYVERHRLS